MRIVKRLAILLRDDFRCCFCEQLFTADKLTVDHLYPISLGGTSRPRNLVAACNSCNNDKNIKTWVAYSERIQERVKRMRRRNYTTALNFVRGLLRLYGVITTKEILTNLSLEIERSYVWKSY